MINGISLNADFDTGNPLYKIFPDNVGYKLPRKPKAYEIRLGKHLGIPYRFFVRKVVITMKDVKDVVRALTEPTRFVLLWSKSPLTLVNPNRVGFIGRDILFKLSMIIILDPIQKVTTIKFHIM